MPETQKTSAVNQTTMELKGDREIVIERTFNGPARIVFDAWTKPEFVRRWWAPKGLGVSVVSIEADVRSGGKYRYVIQARDQEPIGFSGVYSEVTPHTRLAYSQVFEPMAEAGEVVCTVQFHEQGGKTRLVAREMYPSKEVREGVIASGMETGMRMTMDQLDELVASLA